MYLSERTENHLHTLRLVERVSQSLDTVSWVLGGYTADIYIGMILREHDDLDYLTLNLRQLQPKLSEAFTNRGWLIKTLVNGDLSLRKEGIKVHLGNVEFDELARWTHNGEKGSLLFPLSWLSPEPIEFYGTRIHVVAPELQYVLKEHPEFMNSDWQIREKDILDKECLQHILSQKGADIGSLYKLVTSL